MRSVNPAFPNRMPDWMDSFVLRPITERGRARATWGNFAAFANRAEMPD